MPHSLFSYFPDVNTRLQQLSGPDLFCSSWYPAVYSYKKKKKAQQRITQLVQGSYISNSSFRDAAMGRQLKHEAQNQ